MLLTASYYASDTVVRLSQEYTSTQLFPSSTGRIAENLAGSTATHTLAAKNEEMEHGNSRLRAT